MSQGSSSTVVRVTLNEETFAALVDGEAVTLRGYTADGVVTIEITLDKIGSAWLRPALRRAGQTGAAIEFVDLADLARRR
jgi:hypothetical protein